MNFPIEINLGVFKLNLHLIFETLAFILGFRFYLYSRKKSNDKISDSNRLSIIIGATFGALFFSRLIGGLENPDMLMESKNKFFYFFSNKTIMGGLFGGLLGVELVKKMIKEKTSSGDLFVFPLILAIAIGRIGCFTMGVYEPTYGKPTDFITGLNLGDGVLRHPTALYEIAFLMLLALVLTKIKQTHKLKNGELFKIFMITYFIFRFFIEYIKPVYTFSFGLSTIQILCVLLFAYYTLFIVKLKQYVKR